MLSVKGKNTHVRVSQAFIWQVGQVEGEIRLKRQDGMKGRGMGEEVCHG